MQHAVYNRPGCSVVNRLAVGVFELSQYLRLAEDHGIQAGGHCKQMLHRLTVFQDIGVFLEHLCISTALPGPGLDYLPDRRRGSSVKNTKEFHPVAGGKDKSLPGRRQTVYKKTRVHVRQSELFPYIHVRAFMVYAQQIYSVIHLGPECMM